MRPVNIDDIIELIEKQVEKRRLAPGAYSCYSDKPVLNAYGCADAANILYTIGKFPKDSAEREAFVKTLQSIQDPETGLFCEEPENPEYKRLDRLHTTAHCMAALELFDAEPLYSAKTFEQYADPGKFYEYMESIDWRGKPWADSHKPAGLFVALNLGGTDCREFNKAYFKWMWDNADPDTGLWRRGCQDGTVTLWHHMGGTFHYLFNHEYAHMPLHYPDKLIDTCIHMYNNIDAEPYDYGNFYGGAEFIQVDWVYCITRAMQQTPHRFDEAMAVLEDFAERFIAEWKKKDENDRTLKSLHGIFGAVCCFAELQRALRGKIYTDTPMKLVLDRRPFI